MSSYYYKYPINPHFLLVRIGTRLKNIKFSCSEIKHFYLLDKF